MNTVQTIPFTLASALVALLFGCGDSGDIEGEDYGNLLASPAGLVIVEEEHPTGWMRAQCFACHEIRNIHTENRTHLPDEEIDLPGVRAIVRTQGEASCVLCHGDNGVPE